MNFAQLLIVCRAYKKLPPGVASVVDLIPHSTPAELVVDDRPELIQARESFLLALDDVVEEEDGKIHDELEELFSNLDEANIASGLRSWRKG